MSHFRVMSTKGNETVESRWWRLEEERERLEKEEIEKRWLAQVGHYSVQRIGKKQVGTYYWYSLYR